jgi:hypothetical protein
MSKQARLLRVEENPGDAINIFIHGYASDPCPEQLARLRVPSVTYALDWKAGRWKHSVAGGFFYLAGKTAYRIKLARAILAPSTIPVEFAILTAAQAGHFRAMLSRTRKVGRDLLRHVAAIPDAKSRPINLIGHSLGAMVIHTTLLRQNWKRYDLNDCVFLGGAAPFRVGWLDCLKQHRGRIYNGYSAKDMVLMVAPMVSRCIGRRELMVEGQQDRVVNVDCSQFLSQSKLKPIDHHTDYWSKIDKVLPMIWPDASEVSHGSNE